MMKSMTYKIGPLEKCHHMNTQLRSQKPKVSIIEMNDYNGSASDTDSIEKDYVSDSANSREDLTKKQGTTSENNGSSINEIVVINNDVNDKDRDHDHRSDHLSTSDSTSDTNESGFGTVDDESNEKCDSVNHMNEIRTITQQPPIIVYQPLQQKNSQHNQGYISDISSNCPTNSSQQSDNIGKYPQGIKLPTLNYQVSSVFFTFLLWKN